MTLGFDGVTTGAANDIKRATEIAHSMITKWGLSRELGPLMYNEDESHQFLGGQGAGGAGKFGSAETSSKLDKEVRKVIDECYERAFTILTENRDKLDMMADALMKYETIDSKQIDSIMDGKVPAAPEGWTEKHEAADIAKAAADKADDSATTEARTDSQPEAKPEAQSDDSAQDQSASDVENKGNDDKDQNNLH